MKIRVLQFKKLMPFPEPLSTIQNVFEGERPAWITLGKFDTLQTFLLKDSKKSIFDQVEKEQRQLLFDEIGEASQVKNLYLLFKDQEPEWNQDTVFLAVTHVHFSWLFHSEAQEKEIRQLVNGWKTKGVRIHAYRTVEPSDCIVLCASNSMKRIAEISFQIRGTGDVSKVNTHFCIAGKYIGHEIEKEVSDQIEAVDNITLMFSVRRMDSLKARIKEIRECLKSDEVYAISGQDDLQVAVKNYSPVGLINLYRAWLGKDRVPNERWPFAEVTTCVGIRYDGWPARIYDHPEQRLCESLLQGRDRMFSRYSNSYDGIPEWFWQLSALLNVLSGICSSAEMNEFFFLFYPSAKALMNRLEAAQGSGVIIFERKISELLNGWRELNEIVLHSEGKDTTFPALHPHIHSGSFMLMEYMMAFVYRCQDLLKDSDQDSHDILVFPSARRRIETVEVFREEKGLPGLITVSVPALELGKAEDVLSSLAHEISHFVGEKTRAREMRVTCYAQTVSALLCAQLYQTGNESLIEVFAQKAEFGMVSLGKHMRSRMTDQLYTSASMTQDAKTWIGRYFQSPSKEDRTRVFQNLLKYWKAGDGNPFSPMFDDLSQTAEMVKGLSADYANLFREIYADLCMIKILRIREDTYIRIVADEIKGANLTNRPDQGKNATLITAIRIFVCTRICGMSDALIKHFIPCEIHRFLSAVRNTYDKHLDSYNPCSRFMLEQFMGYAELCSAQLDELMEEKKEETKAVRKAFQLIIAPGKTANLEEMVKVVEEYRKRFIEQDL